MNSWETDKIIGAGTTILHDRGIPTTNKALRPELKQEAANLDTENYSDRENYCADYCPLNVGNVSTYGVQFYRAARKVLDLPKRFRRNSSIRCPCVWVRTSTPRNSSVTVAGFERARELVEKLDFDGTVVFGQRFFVNPPRREY